MCRPGWPGDPRRELVQLYDADGHAGGVTTRTRVRAHNLTHAATAVVVRDPHGRVHVHRRTDTKDLYPGRLDFAAGGVVAAGEDPGDAAVRELAEELGVTGVSLRPVRVAHFGDDHTDYWGHCFTVTWDGPVRLQPEEVAWGEWWTLDRLVAALTDDRDAWMPDTAGLLGDWLRERLADRREVDDQGWDSVAEVVEGRWLDRVPRRPEVGDALRVEARLMARIAPLLPLQVPVPVVLDEEPLRLRHVLVPGTPAVPARLTAADGHLVGRFLRALHDQPASTWEGTGLAADLDRVGVLEEMTELVLPRLPADLHDDARELLDRCREACGLRVLRHGDLGPAHLLVTDGGVSGVIDWTDVGLGDPALDLAWTVHGTPGAFRDALVAAYSPTGEELSRGRDRHLLGPWYEALWGLTGGPAEYVGSGLSGVVERLRATPYP